MNKKIIFSILMIFVIISGVFAAQFDDATEQIKKKIKEDGILEENIGSITQVDFDHLPDEVKIDKTEDVDVSIYKVEQKQDKPFFVITAGSTLAKKTSSESYSTSFLSFGYNGVENQSVFLKTSSGITGGEDKGYIMMRKGSITGISTNLQVLNSDKENSIEIMIYKNGEEIGFRNNIYAGEGMRKDYEVQSREIVNFEPGDSISVFVKTPEGIFWKDAITLIEISTINQ